MSHTEFCQITSGNRVAAKSPNKSSSRNRPGSPEPRPRSQLVAMTRNPWRVERRNPFLVRIASHCETWLVCVGRFIGLFAATRFGPRTRSLIHVRPDYAIRHHGSERIDFLGTYVSIPNPELVDVCQPLEVFQYAVCRIHSVNPEVFQSLDPRQMD